MAHLLLRLLKALFPNRTYAAALITFLVSLFVQRARARRLAVSLHEERVLRAAEMRKTEEQRAGRTRIERELRRLMVDQGNFHKGLGEPIGYIESCFRERNGTPRQGGVVPLARSTLKLTTNINPVHALEGLEQYSHVWLIFIFHENTNVTRGVREDRPSSVVKAKVAPPRLDGKRVGLFSTRTPHRPNPIGLSLARLDRIENGTLYLLGADLVHGTPVLDVKPYLPNHDSAAGATAPSWTIEAPIVPLKSVEILPEAEDSMRALMPTLKYYREYDELRALIKQVLIQDIRSVRRRKYDQEYDRDKRKSKARVIEDDGQPERHRVSIDNLNVVFIVVDNVCTVVTIEKDSILDNEASNNALDQEGESSSVQIDD